MRGVTTFGRLATGLLSAGLLVGSARAEAPVVARVEGPRGGFTIDADRLAGWLAAHPEQSPREGLAALVDFELLAAEAAAAGVDDPRVDAAADRARVAVWLDQVFEPMWTAETMPEEAVRRSFEQNRAFFEHPELRTADHILVTTTDTRRPTGALDETARAFAERIAREVTAAAPADREAFRALGERYAGEAPEGLQVLVQDLRRFARRGKYAADFGDGAFAIDGAGDIGAPFPTSFGWHVVRIDAIEPAKRTPFEEAEAELRPRIVPEVRQYEFMKLTDRLADALPKLRDLPGVRGLVNTAPLDAVAARRGLGEAPPEGQ